VIALLDIVAVNKLTPLALLWRLPVLRFRATGVVKKGMSDANALSLISAVRSAKTAVSLATSRRPVAAAPTAVSLKPVLTVPSKAKALEAVAVATATLGIQAQALALVLPRPPLPRVRLRLSKH
jgi:hypothetical protein